MKSIVIYLDENFSAAVAVCSGAFGDGEERKTSLEEIGFDYEKVQEIVNDLFPVMKKHGVV